MLLFLAQIVEKLDGKVTRKAADCTHFVADKFVRTGNMLEAMAGGKFVVTFAWLESCRIANCFIEERNFILQDERKERELGFSMRATILAAQQKSLLQGVRVLLTPNINPAPQVLTSIVHAAGGQVRNYLVYDCLRYFFPPIFQCHRFDLLDRCSYPSWEGIKVTESGRMNKEENKTFTIFPTIQTSLSVAVNHFFNVKVTFFGL